MNLQSAATGLRLGQPFEVRGGLRLGQGTGLILDQGTELRLASPAVESSVVVNHAKNTCDNLTKLLTSGEHSDVTFIIAGDWEADHRIPAHRVILASQSEYFDRLLFGEMREAHAGAEILLPNTPLEAFRLLLQYAYCGKVATSDLEVALQLLGLADQYQFPKLKAELDEILISEVNDDNALQMAVYSDKHSAKMLKKKSWEYADENANSVLESEALISIPREDLVRIISRDLFLAEEVNVFNAVHRWIAHNSEDASDLLQCVRLCQIPATQLFETVRPSGLYSDKEILDAIFYQTNPELNFMHPRGYEAKTNLFEKTGTVVKECHGFSEVSKPQDQLSKRIRLTGNVIVIADKLFEVNTILQRPGSSEGYIIIKFDKLYLCNELKLNVQSGTNWDYDVSVSSDSTSWNSVVHYEKFQCCSFQQLYFPTQAARYMRITQLQYRCPVKLELQSCSLCHSVPFSFRKNGVLAPSRQFTPVYVCTRTPNQPECVIKFNQPYAISSMRFTVHVDGVTGRARGSFSLKNGICHTIHDQDLMSEIHVTFKEHVMSTVRVVMTRIICEDRRKDVSGYRFSIDGFSCQA